MVVTTNQSILRSVPSVFPFPPGDSRLRPVNRSQVASAHRYVPWITVTNFAGQGYGDAACFIEFRSGPAKGGKIIYIWSTLLAGPQGPSLLADAVSWILEGTLRPPAPRFNSINLLNHDSAALDFSALANLAYALQYTNTLGPGTNPWPFFRDFGSSPVDKFISFTTSVSAVQSRFFRIWVRP